MASPVHCHHSQKMLKKQSTGRNKIFKQLALPGGSHGEEKRKTTIYLCNVHCMHSMPCAKNKEQSTCTRNKRKNGFSQTPPQQ